MKIEELRAPEGSTRARKRRGRGNATGQGKTGGRGMNGQKQRSGGKVRLGFEGGQMPLYRRLPKRGFTNIWGTTYAIINVGDLVTPEILQDMGILKRLEDGVKILGNGELTNSITVKASKFSKAAKEKIEAAGGKAEVI